MFYTLIKIVLYPLMLVYFRPRFEGRLPRKGGIIVASNHDSFLDHFIFPLMVRRRMTYLAKSELFDSAFGKFFFTNMGQIPLHRGKGDREAFAAALRLLRNGGALGIYPEGTRSPDGKLWKGHTGIARLAMMSGCPVVPIGMIGTFEAHPKGAKFPKPLKVIVRIGKPMDFSAYRGKEADKQACREVTDKIMYAIAELTGEEYDPGRGYMDPHVMPEDVRKGRVVVEDGTVKGRK